MEDISVTNVVNVQVIQPGATLGPFNPSNTALFTHEVPGESFPGAYGISNSDISVKNWFGTNSVTGKMATAIFSQRPNILAFRGYLAIIPMTPGTQTITPDETPVAGEWVVNFEGAASAPILFADTLSQIQAKIRAVAGLGSVVVTGSIVTVLTISMAGVYGIAPLITITGNTLEDGVTDPVTLTVAQTVAGETFAEAIIRASGIVQFFSAQAAAILSDADALAAAAVIQASNKMAVMAFKAADSIEPGEIIDLLRTGSYQQTRGLYYGSDDDLSALLFQAGYVGRGFSTNFDGSNTTQNMHLKEIIGSQPSPVMDQTVLQKCLDSGADTYISIEGLSKIFSSGANNFFDRVYNLGWFVGALQVADFNVFAQVGTKIAQTESGMDLLKKASRGVCLKAVSNGYLAAGSWTLPTTFGNQEDLFANVEQFGFYIYSEPVSLQDPAARASREAPLQQLAIKESGAFNSASILVNVNA